MSYVVANWKMEMSLSDVKVWLDGFSQNFTEVSRVITVIAPSFVHIYEVAEEMDGLEKVSIGAQDVSVELKGSHTGEVGAFQIKDFCNYCIIGHSERAENTMLVVQKRDVALEHGLKPIVCFTSLSQAELLYKEGVILAWEDPKNISSDGIYNEKPIKEIIGTVAEIRRYLPEESVLLYGGSVNKGNISALASVSGLNGVLVGQASLDPHHFLKLIEAYEVS